MWHEHPMASFSLDTDKLAYGILQWTRAHSCQRQLPKIFTQRGKAIWFLLISYLVTVFLQWRDLHPMSRCMKRATTCRTESLTVSSVNPGIRAPSQATTKVCVSFFLIPILRTGPWHSPLYLEHHLSCRIVAKVERKRKGKRFTAAVQALWRTFSASHRLWEPHSRPSWYQGEKIELSNIGCRLTLNSFWKTAFIHTWLICIGSQMVVPEWLCKD